MKKHSTAIVLLYCLMSSALGVLSWSNSNNQERVLLKEVTTITLTDGKMTSGRRSSPVPQLDCVGGTSGCYRHRPKVVQCKNVGFDGYDVQWECTADLDNSVRFGRIEVSCEGYDSPNDPYILRGSCGLRYELDSTQNDSIKPSFSIFMVVLVIVVVIIIIVCIGGGSNTSSSGGRVRHKSHSTRSSSSKSRSKGSRSCSGFGGTSRR